MEKKRDSCGKKEQKNFAPKPYPSLELTLHHFVLLGAILVDEP